MNRSGGIILGIDFVDRRTGWAVGGAVTGAIIAHTADGGETWEDQNQNIEGPAGSMFLRDLAFRDATHGVAVGGAADFFGPPIVLVTTTGGAQWRPAVLEGLGEADAAGLESVCLTTAGSGVALGDGLVLVTSDGGFTWQKVGAQLAAPVRGGAVDCVDATGLWIVGRGGTLAFSPDGGTTWTALPPPAPVGTQLQDASFVDAQTGWLMGLRENSAFVFRTLDGGATWSEHHLVSGRSGVSDPTFALAFVDRQRGVVVGRDSSAFFPFQPPADLFSFVTVDGGLTWTQGSFTPPPIVPRSAVTDVDLVP